MVGSCLPPQMGSWVPSFNCTFCGHPGQPEIGETAFVRGICFLLCVRGVCQLDGIGGHHGCKKENETLLLNVGIACFWLSRKARKGCDESLMSLECALLLGMFWETNVDCAWL